MNRREFMKTMSGLGCAAIVSSLLESCSTSQDTLVEPTALKPASPTSESLPPTSLPAIPTTTLQIPATEKVSTARVVLVKTDDRSLGVQRALDILDVQDVQDRNFLIKPNLNSDDPAPGSTHTDVLTTLHGWLKSRDVGQVSLGDRSGMAATERVLEVKGIQAMSEEFGFEVLNFHTLPAHQWELITFDDSHWQYGFPIAKPVLESEGIVSVCCLKTHRFGGHFTMSLKNSVGMVASYIPGESHGYMTELHNSKYQREMIAEINTAYQPDVILLDGMEAFVGGGPESGMLVHPGVVLAGTDRVAIDAVGVAILRNFGTTHHVQKGPVFEQAQIARAAELGIGISQPDMIEIVTDDDQSAEYASVLQSILLEA
jgi:uncharacterized protein (DUF362 family)